METALLVLLVVIMSVTYFPRVLHEVGGILFGCLTAAHMGQNRHWFTGLSQGRWTAFRALTAGISLLLVLTLVAVLASGVPISNEVFSSLFPLAMRQNVLLHQLHRSLPFVLVILAGLHIGLHWRTLRAYAAQCVPSLWRSGDILAQRAGRGVLRYAGALLLALGAAGGIYGSFQFRVGDHLLMRHIFATPAMQGSALRYMGLLFGVLLLYGAIGAGMELLLAYRQCAEATRGEGE